MRFLPRQWLMVSIVALLVVLAGCGGTGGDTGDSTTTAPPTESPTTATSTDVATTAGTQNTPSPTSDTTTTSGPPAFQPSSHSEAIQEAGSYTVEFTIESSAGTSSGAITGTQQIDIETGELYMSFESASDGQSTAIEYYRPPNSDTYYQHVAGQTQEVSDVQGIGYNFSDPGTGTEGEAWPEFSHTGSGTTDLGAATTYAVDSVEDLPDSTADQYENVTDVQFTIWVDDDTGIIAKYSYQLTYMQDGEEQTVEVTFEITDLGSTEVEEPSWVP